MDKLKNHQRIYDRTRIVILFTLIVLAEGSALREMSSTCPSTCSCGYPPNATFSEIKCPSINPQIVVQMKAYAVVLLKCQIFDQKVYTQLPNLTVGDVSLGVIKGCPLPSGSSIQLVLDRLGVEKIRGLTIQNNGKNLGPVLREHFTGLLDLRWLSFNSTDTANLPEDLFIDMKGLIYLELHQTNLHLSNNTSRGPPERLFRENKRMKSLRLFNNRMQFSTLPSELLSNLSELREVFINFQLKMISENFFNETTNLRNLSLARNLIESLPAGLFKKQIKLLDVDLSHNKLTELPDDLFVNTRLLQTLSLSHNQLVSISRNVLRNLKDLRTLFLNDNQLHHIHPHSFSYTKAIQKIYAENNRLSFKEEGLEGLRNLNLLNLRNNSIESVSSNWMLNLTELQELDLSRNIIQLLPYSALQFLSTEIKVNLTHNQIIEIDLEGLAFKNTSGKVINDRKNAIILIDWNPLICDCGIFHFALLSQKHLVPNVKSFPKILNENLYCNAPPQLKGKLVANINLEELICPLDSDYSADKKCPNNCTCFKRSYDRALIVNCSNADLTKVPALPRLLLLNLNFTELYIENNNIMKLPNANTPGYADVRFIYSRNNNINEISSDNLPKGLELLDLTKNNLERLNVSKFQNQTLKSVKKLYLASNPWICDCSAVELISFIYTNFKIIHDLEKLECTSGEKVLDLQPANLCYKEDNIIFVAIVPALLLSLCIGILAALYYKYQQQIKVWLFINNWCLWPEEELDKDRKYDAFISYSHKDEDFVTEHLIPELEGGENPFKLCIHIRDWVVGEFIPNQIARSVENSKRTIFVLSPNFLESIWGRMEFRAAHTAALREGRARVIVIIYGDIGDTNKLDPELKAYLKMNTYMKWGDPWFWDKLRYAMPHPINNLKRKRKIRENILETKLNEITTF